MRIGITGHAGFVGTRAVEKLRKNHDLFMFPKEDLRMNNTEKIIDFACENGLEAIVHTAAVSDVGTCEKNPELSKQANVLLSVSMAKAASKAGARLLAFSSDQVYTGCPEEGPYPENIQCRPANVYGRDKLEMEKRVLDVHPESMLLRATWMYDMPGFRYANRGNYLTILLGSVLHDRALTMGSDYRGITWVREVAEQIENALSGSVPGGVYNFGSMNDLDMYALTVEALSALGVRKTVERNEASKHNLWMDCSKAEKQGIHFASSIDGFRACLKAYALDIL